jgi:predicted ArsR family transcriptional regulator
LAGVDIPRLDPDDVLAQPSRRRLFTALAEIAGAASTDELAERLGLHPNGVRSHLARLHEAGLVVRRRVALPRGRPRDEWAVAPGARPAGDPPRAYGVLATWLARSIPATPDRLGEVEALGREVGRALTPANGGPAERAIGDAMAALGFQPSVRRRPRGGMSCRLDNCPYREAVRARRDVVCTLHRGLTRGLLDRLAPAATLTRFVPRDPDAAGCEVDIDGLPPPSGPV